MGVLWRAFHSATTGHTSQVFFLKGGDSNKSDTIIKTIVDINNWPEEQPIKSSQPWHGCQKLSHDHHEIYNLLACLNVDQVT